MSESIVRYELRGNVAVLTMDDGKANALSNPMMQALHAGLDRAEKEAKAVLLVGRPKRLCAGFDLSVMTQSLEAMQSMVLDGAELLMRMYLFPRPVVIACTGHALAAGALLLLAADRRLGAAGDWKIGLNEVSIAMPLPTFAVELARDRLSPRYFAAATTMAQIFDPSGAVEAGYLDATVEPGVLLDTALADAERMAALPDPAFRLTKQRERGESVRRIRATLKEDITQLTTPRPPGA